MDCTASCHFNGVKTVKIHAELRDFRLYVLFKSVSTARIVLVQW